MESVETKKPNEKMKAVWILSWFIGGFLLTLLLFLPILLVSLYGDSSSGITPFWTLISWILFLFVYGLLAVGGSILYYNSWSYGLEEDFIVLNFGIIWKKTNRIPYARIQNVNVIRGPILRIFGLCKVHVETAGKSSSMAGWGSYGTSPEGWIPGPIEGERIAEDVLRRVREQHNRALSSGL